MRKIVFFLTLVTLPVYLYAQVSPADKLFEKYSGREGYTSVYISRYMFSLFSKLETDDQEIENVLGRLTGIRILTTDAAPPAGVNFFTEIMRDLPAGEYEELMVIREKDQDFKFLIRERDGLISELLLVGGGTTNNVLISIQGNIDLKTISSLSRSLKIEGLDKLDKLEDK